MLSHLTPMLIFVAALATLAAAQSTSRFDDLLDDLAGTWSTGSGAVRTGPVCIQLAKYSTCSKDRASTHFDHMFPLLNMNAL